MIKLYQIYNMLPLEITYNIFKCGVIIDQKKPKKIIGVWFYKHHEQLSIFDPAFHFFVWTNKLVKIDYVKDYNNYYISIFPNNIDNTILNINGSSIFNHELLKKIIAQFKSANFRICDVVPKEVLKDIREIVKLSTKLNCK